MATEICRIPAEALGHVRSALVDGGSAYVCSASPSTPSDWSAWELVTPTLAFLGLLTAFSYYYASLQYGRDRDIATKRKLAQDEFGDVTAPLVDVKEAFEYIGDQVLELMDTNVDTASVLEKARFRSRAAMHSLHSRVSRLEAWTQDYDLGWDADDLLDTVSENYDGILEQVRQGLRQAENSMAKESRLEFVLSLCSDLRAHCTTIAREMEQAVRTVDMALTDYDFGKTVPSILRRLPFVPPSA